MNSLSSRSKPISQFLLSRSSSSSIYRILCISLFSTSSSSSSSSFSSQSNYSSSPASPSRRQDEESKNVRVSVWWDIENCSIPNGVNVFKITHFITSAVRANGIKGPLQVNAFGDVLCLTRSNQEALSSTGVNLVHIPQGGKNSADRSLLVDLMYWVSQNPPPAHVFLISGDRDFAGILHKLRMNNYNILLAGESKQTPGVLCSAASIMWRWNELAKGENLSGRHFNQPPDGPFNSWYGHYRGPLEDPYAASELKIRLEADNVSKADLSFESHPVPVTILRQLRRIINAHPNGLTITDLRSEMTKRNVSIDKNFYGYTKFSHFLLSMPHIVKVKACADGQFFLRPASPKVRESIKGNGTSVGSMTENKNQDVEEYGKGNGQTHTITRMVDAKPQSPVSPYVDGRERTVGEKAAKVTPEEKELDGLQRDNQVGSTKDFPGEASTMKAVEIPVSPKDKQHSENKIGLFKRLWFGPSADSKKTSADTSGKLNTSSGCPEMSTFKEEETKLINQHGAQQPAHSSSSTALNEDAKINISDESEANLGFITRVINWCKSWRNLSVSTSTEQSSEVPEFIEETSKKFDDASHSRKHELFSKDAFWSSLHMFLKTRRGSDIVLNSTSREHFAERLQKEGPLILRPFQETDLHHLLDLLVSEKKWIAEFPTKTPRFRIIHPPAESPAEPQPQNVQPHSSNGLSSIFMGSSSEETSPLNVSSPLQKKPSEKPRSEVLADCQKLLDELLSQYPEGFNMGLFKSHFVDKYGYALDHQKLGYPKLVSLLQIMPGVKVESAYIYPDSVVYSSGIASLGLREKSSGSEGNVPDLPRKNEDGESPWEELGPVENQERKSTCNNYEPSVSDDDDFSDMEEDTSSSLVKVEDQNRSKVNQEDSSLLQILDSWYSTKDKSDTQDHGSRAEGSVDCSKEASELPESSNSTNVKGETAASSAINPARKQRPQKSYTFVADPIETTKKDKLIDGILGSLKKSGESKMQE